MDKKDFDTALKSMTDARKAGEWDKKLSGLGATGGRNVLCGFISTSGQGVSSSYPCHAPILNYKNALVLWSAFGYRVDKQIAETYFEWLIHHSPWAKTGIVPKMLEDVMFETGFIFSDLDKTPANLLHNFLIATRMAAEWPLLIQSWYDLVQLGFDPSYAYLMVTVFTPHNDTKCCSPSFKEGINHSLATIDKYDWPLDMARASEEYLLNFIHGNPVGVSKVMYYPTAETRPVNLIWGIPVDNKKKYINILNELYSKYSTIIEYKDPFREGMTQKNVYTFKSVLEIIRLEEKRLQINNLRKAA